MGMSNRFICPICQFSCGRNKKLQQHFLEHGFASIEDAYNQLVLNGKPILCLCGCEKKTQFYGWNKGYAQYLSGHNGNLSHLDSGVAEEIVRKRNITKIENGHTSSWAKGLTKENSDSLKQGAKKRSATLSKLYRTGQLHPWSKGRTKENDDRLLKQSNDSKLAYASGKYQPWAKGLSKESDPRVADMAINVKKSMNDKSRRKRLDGLKRLSAEEISRRLEAGSSLFELISNIDDYTRDRHINMKFRCKNCDLVQTKSLLQALSNKCDSCTPPTSAGHADMIRWLQENTDNVLSCDRSVIAPYELDIVLPHQGIAVEYNGLYFHSSVFKDKDYHAMKTRMARDAGFRLIHVFEDEWLQRPDVVKSSLLHAIGKSPRTIFARKCSLSVVNSAQKRDFFNVNHMDGDAGSSTAWGLFYEDKMVACLSLRKPMQKKHKNSLEICRFATLNNVHVVGGLGKLTASALQHCRSIGCCRLMTYVDTRFGDGGGYRAVGFVDVETTVNRFWWTDGKNRIDRFKVRADKEAGLTEQQVADQHGVVKIWGCPNLVMEVRIDQK